MRYVLEMHGLTRIARIFSVEIAFSIDSAALTEGTSHIFAACKNIDPRSQKIGKLLYMEIDENGVRKYKSLQSNEKVYLMVMVHARDGKEPYQFFFFSRNGLNLLTRSRQKGYHIEMRITVSLKPFLVRIPQDVSSIQKPLIWEVRAKHVICFVICVHAKVMVLHLNL